MSAEQDKVRSIAERIAQRLGRGGADASTEAAAGEAGELAQLRANVRELQQRLAHVESHVAHGGNSGQQTGATGGDSRPSAQGQGEARTAPTPAQWMSSTYVPATHPSQERFGIDEAVSELVDYFEREKTCAVEPGGKPCDHCAMCSSRGF